jgi:aspartate/methionine/tyrosine aminotransferase
MFSRRTPHSMTPNALALRVAEKRRSGARLLDLTETNPTMAGLSPAAEEIARALAGRDLARYEPEARGAAPAREAVARYYAERAIRQARVSPDRIILTASTSEAYAHIFRLLGDDGDEFLAPVPSYPLFEPLAALENVRLVPYELRYDGRWRIDAGEIARLAGPRTRAIILVSPNNPTGSVTLASEAREIEQLAGERGIAIVSDEVFGDFITAPSEASARGMLAASPHHILSPTLAGARDALTFVLSGLSKVAGLPQLKLGWIAAAGPERLVTEALDRLEWITDAFLSVGGPAEQALPQLLATRHAFQSRAQGRITTNRARLAAALASRPDFELLNADGGWSAVIRLPRTRSEEEWCLALLDRGVLVHPGHFYDFPDEAYIVVSLLPEASAFAEAAERIVTTGA